MTETAHRITLDGNEAAASVAYRASEVIAIYPITPSSTMGELADEWAAERRPNLFGGVPDVVEMQSEGGAAGAVHGALQAGALATTFTASQGLLLMIPNMYKIAGELTAFCMHVAARAVATHALSIFGDHSDVMACRQTGFAMLASGSVQEAHDMAAIAHAATLRARVPFLHFFDGFRTSHEVAKIEELADDDLRALLDAAAIAAHRARGLSPDHPVIRGTAQNPDAFFQAREAANPFYAACPRIVEETMARFAERTGRRYRLFDYMGHPEPERVLVVMGSAAETADETVRFLGQRYDRVGVVKVRLYRPFDASAFAAALPESVRSIAVLDRTKEPGAPGEPLYLDVVAALKQTGHANLRVIGGRYGLASKELTPAMIKAALDELKKPAPQHPFTLGIIDDVTHLSLPIHRDFEVESDDVVRAVFYGLGSDGTVGANKNSIKIIGEETELFAQGYFVYDSKKSGAVTVSHLRFGPRPIRSSYLVSRASFVACHQWSILERQDVLARAADGATFLVNAPFPAEEVFDRLPARLRERIVDDRLRLFAIDADRVAREAGMGGRINTIMQVCFFALSGVLPRDEAIARIKDAIAKTYKKKGEDVVARNCAAVDAALAHLREVLVPARLLQVARLEAPRLEEHDVTDFARRVTLPLLAGEGDWLPVSAFPVDGTWPVGTSKLEKRGLAREIPVWEPDLCIQCNKCAFVCPHAAIRAKTAAEFDLESAPPTMKWTDFRAREKGAKYLLQIAPEDCTGCELCVHACPAHEKGDEAHRALAMQAQPPLRDAERENFAFFERLPEADRAKAKLDVKGSQFLEPLFEFSGACAGCGETPYVKLLTQLFGDRALIANATGCSSIFGGNLPTTPYTTNRDGRGPAWANSLFEDNAEFGLGFRLALDRRADEARRLLQRLAPDLELVREHERVGNGARPEAETSLAKELLENVEAASEAEIAAQRRRVDALRERLGRMVGDEARRLEAAADHLVPKSVWIVGGDGWAYDIGYGGLDHVLALGRKVNVLVLDTEVYSNTGGQQSKATPLGATARFAAAGKARPKKDLALMAMAYGDIYVARVASGAKDAQTVKALLEAESYPGPSLVIALSPCIAHGYDLAEGLDHQRLAVETGAWPLLRFDPRRAAEGKCALELDSGPPSVDVARYLEKEGRFRAVEQHDPARYAGLVGDARRAIADRYALYERLAAKR